jgi:hypothetical protein
MVKVSATELRVEHEVKLTDLTKWRDQTGGFHAR